MKKDEKFYRNDVQNLKNVIKDLAPYLKPTAHSEDNFIEGIEKDNILAVQWHPERLTHDRCHLNLAKYFIDKCRH